MQDLNFGLSIEYDINAYHINRYKGNFTLFCCITFDKCLIPVSSIFFHPRFNVVSVYNKLFIHIKYNRIEN